MTATICTWKCHTGLSKRAAGVEVMSGLAQWHPQWHPQWPRLWHRPAISIGPASGPYLGGSDTYSAGAATMEAGNTPVGSRGISVARPSNRPIRTVNNNSGRSDARGSIFK